ncbi:MAG: polyprenyl synthetase family protein [Candidatus Bathyarchaeota archaeon]|jgi:geranylgeranyl diphosphate synthase type I|nr:polyprenyl synthetase family protein [Candidatus Bathyarchaeota archaeon]
MVSALKVDDYIFNLLEDRKPVVLYEASRHLFHAGGKRLRPYLVLKSCELVDGNPCLALPFAAGLEILHNFTLIHDDIMDNDSFRRGNPTIHSKWGVPMAIASGDLLFAKVYQAMYAPYFDGSLPSESVLKSIKAVTDATISICEGQVLDISFPDTRDVSPQDYILMVGGKTSALFSACAKIGAIVGGANRREVKMLASFAWDAGIAFQIVDDILGVTANDTTLGKPIGSDLREGKKTLIVVYALKNTASREKENLLRVLGDQNADSQDIDAAIETLRSSGAINYAKKKAADYVKSSKESLKVFPDIQARQDLLELVDYFSSRDY